MKAGRVSPRGMAFFSTSEEEKRREVETVADSTDSERTKLPHGRYFEVPTFSRWSFALYLALSTRSRLICVLSTNFALPFAFYHGCILHQQSFTYIHVGSFSRFSVKPIVQAFNLTLFRRFVQWDTRRSFCWSFKKMCVDFGSILTTGNFSSLFRTVVDSRERFSVIFGGVLHRLFYERVVLVVLAARRYVQSRSRDP